MNHKGQNIIEYVLLVAAVVLVCLVFLGKQGPMKKAVEGSLNSAVNQIDKLNKEIQF